MIQQKLKYDDGTLSYIVLQWMSKVADTNDCKLWIMLSRAVARSEREKGCKSITISTYLVQKTVTQE